MIYSVYTTTCYPEGGSVSFVTTCKDNALAYAKAWWETDPERYMDGVMVLEWPEDQQWTLKYSEEDGMSTEVFRLGFEEEEEED